MKKSGSSIRFELNSDQIKYISKNTSQDPEESKKKELYLREIKSAIAKGQDPALIPVPGNEKSGDGGIQLSGDIASRMRSISPDPISRANFVVDPLDHPISRANSVVDPLEYPISRANSVVDPLDSDIAKLTAPQLKYIFKNTSQDPEESKKKELYLREIKSAIAKGQDPALIPVPGNEKSGDSPNTGVGVNKGAGATLKGSSSQRELP